jgi:hypothetical protein
LGGGGGGGGGGGIKSLGLALTVSIFSTVVSTAVDVSTGAVTVGVGVVVVVVVVVAAVVLVVNNDLIRSKSGRLNSKLVDEESICAADCCGCCGVSFDDDDVARNGSELVNWLIIWFMWLLAI